MVIILEGMTLCFLMLLVCVVGIADGPEGAVFFYEKDVQKRVVELGLTTEGKIRKRKIIGFIALIVPMLLFAPLMVYFINGARGFTGSFVQLLIIYMIEGVFDRLFIDCYWVGKSHAWIIPGTEDLMPYVPKKVYVGKWIATLVGYPIIAVMMAGVLAMF